MIKLSANGYQILCNKVAGTNTTYWKTIIDLMNSLGMTFNSANLTKAIYILADELKEKTYYDERLIA